MVIIIIQYFQKSYEIDLTPKEYFLNLGEDLPEELVQNSLSSFHNLQIAETLIHKVGESPMKSVKEMLKKKIKNKRSSRLPKTPKKTSKTFVKCKTRNDLTNTTKMKIFPYKKINPIKKIPLMKLMIVLKKKH